MFKSSHWWCSVKKVLWEFSQVLQEKTCVGVTFQEICTHLGLQLYSKETPIQAFSSEICNNFQSTYFEEHLWTIASVRYYNGEKILRNTSTSCEDCFLGSLKSDKGKKIFFYHWYENFKRFGCGWFWMVLAGCVFYN